MKQVEVSSAFSLGEAAFSLIPSWLADIVLHFEALVGREWQGSPDYSELVLNNWLVTRDRALKDILKSFSFSKA